MKILCKECGEPCIKPKTQSLAEFKRKRKFCSVECKNKYRVKMNREKYAIKKCGKCGKGLDKYYLKTYCSVKCYRVTISDQELMDAMSVEGGRAELARKYNLSPAAITHRCQKLLTKIQ